MQNASHATLVVAPTLHGSGFGNQIGMLLLHVSLASLSRRTLVLPPFAFKELNYALFQRRTAGLPTEAGRRARYYLRHAFDLNPTLGGQVRRRLLATD